MQPHSFQGHDLADIPPPFFPDEALAAPVLSRPAAGPATLADGHTIKAAGPIPSRALRLVRAKSGETEMRLLALDDAGEVSYVLVTATLAPYKEKREPLVTQGEAKTLMNYHEALQEFDRRVALAYPPEKLRHGRTVEIHINLI